MKDKRPDLYDLYEDDYSKHSAGVRVTGGLITRRQLTLGSTLGVATLGLSVYGSFRPQANQGNVPNSPLGASSPASTP